MNRIQIGCGREDARRGGSELAATLRNAAAHDARAVLAIGIAEGWRISPRSWSKGISEMVWDGPLKQGKLFPVGLA